MNLSEPLAFTGSAFRGLEHRSNARHLVSPRPDQVNRQSWRRRLEVHKREAGGKLVAKRTDHDPKALCVRDVAPYRRTRRLLGDLRLEPCGPTSCQDRVVVARGHVTRPELKGLLGEGE
jgi:hypothetical protein